MKYTFILLLVDSAASWLLRHVDRPYTYRHVVAPFSSSLWMVEQGHLDPNHSSSMDRAFYNTAQEFASILKDPSHINELNLELVKRGKMFDMQQERNKMEYQQHNTNHVHQFPHPQRVPGCVANVHVQTTLIPVMDGRMIQSYKVTVQGDADALISKGLLATLAALVSSESVYAHQILDMDPNTVADQLGLRSFLSSGRNDGLASMTRVIQDQIRSLLSVDPINPSQPQSVSHSNTKPTVAMLLSGGVDSSVALHLLLQQNYNVTAFYLKIWLEDELAHLGQCPWEDDYKTCQLVCEHASQRYGVTVPLESISLQKEYKERVISYTVHEAKRGRTPNPDIMCNR